jgi:hypothetical protein
MVQVAPRSSAESVCEDAAKILLKAGEQQDKYDSSLTRV